MRPLPARRRVTTPPESVAVSALAERAEEPGLIIALRRGFALFDPAAESFRVIQLPSKNVGIRKAITDAKGRYWYMGSHNGRLGMIE